MKRIKLTFLIFPFSILFGFTQTESDIIDFDNINLNLIDSLIFEEACKQRDIYKSVPLRKDKLCGLAAKYQSDYMSFYNTAGHTNDKKFQGVLLKKCGDRVRYFEKKINSNKKIKTYMEIMINMPGIKSRNYIGFEKKDYQTLSKAIIVYFMDSPHHKMALLYTTNLSYVEIHGNFKTSYNKENDSFYITGVLTYVML